MFKRQQIQIILSIFLFILSALGAACSKTDATPAPKPTVRAAEAPTPEYKPPRRVSRDVIKDETKKNETKKEKSN